MQFSEQFNSSILIQSLLLLLEILGQFICFYCKLKTFGFEIKGEHEKTQEYVTGVPCYPGVSYYITFLNNK